MTKCENVHATQRIGMSRLVTSRFVGLEFSLTANEQLLKLCNSAFKKRWPVNSSAEIDWKEKQTIFVTSRTLPL